MSFRLNLSSYDNLNYFFSQNSLNFQIRVSSQQNVIITRFSPVFGKKLRSFRGYSDCEMVVWFSGILSMVSILSAKLILTQLNPLKLRRTLYNLRFLSHCQYMLGCMYFFKVLIKIMTKYWQKHRGHRRNDADRSLNSEGYRLTQTNK